MNFPWLKSHGHIAAREQPANGVRAILALSMAEKSWPHCSQYGINVSYAAQSATFPWLKSHGHIAARLLLGWSSGLNPFHG